MKKIFTFLLLLASYIGFAQSTTIVISQFYGAGGNSGAVLNADYVELHNISSSAQSLNGLSLQYESANPSGTWATTIAVLPNVSIPSGGYYLVQMSNAGLNGSALPAPDFSANVAMGGSNGIVALVVGTTVISGCPTSNIVDLVGFGTATCYEGSAATPAVSSTLAGFRINDCTDTNNNGADFTTGAPAPKNSASAPSVCSAVPPALTVSGTINDFGNVTIGSSSASQVLTISGSNLTGAPGNFLVSAGPSTYFEFSLDNTNWSQSLLVPYSSPSLASTNIYIRFTPQTAGGVSESVTISGGGADNYIFVVNGNGVAPVTPFLTAGSLTAFGDVCLNTTTSPHSFTLNGINLSSADITVGSLAGFGFSTTSTGTFTPSLTISQTGGTFTQTVYVNFTPVGVQSYDGNIVITGAGAPSINVEASGTGVNNPPAVSTAGSSAVTLNAATLAGSITATGCSALTAYGIEYSTTNGFANGTGTAVASTNLNAGAFTSTLSSLAAATTYYYKAYATNAGGTTYGSQLSFMTAIPVLTATPLTAFGSQCVNSITGPNSFTINSTGLSAANVTVGPLNGYTFSTTSGGTYTNSLSITHAAGAFTQAVFVKFNPTAIQSYNGNIPVGGGGANTINVAASGSGVNLPATVSTEAATSITTQSVTLNGTITGVGCSNITAYGFEYSGVNNFTGGNGVKVFANNSNSSGVYSVDVNGLIHNTTYYFRSFASNGAGTNYGPQQSFTTIAIPEGLVLYNIPVQRNSALRFSITGIKPDHYGILLINSNGQLVFRKDIITQVSFINDQFIIPSSITPGVYQFRLENYNGFRIKRTIVIK